MSEENRDAESGQYVAAEEPKFGLEGVEAEAGFTRMPDPAKEQDWSIDSGNDAAEVYAALSDPPPETVEIFYRNPDGSQKDPNETVTLERAAEDLTAYHGDRDADMEAALGKEWAAEIDKLRADRIKTAADAEHFGVPLPKAEKAAPVEEVATHEPDAYDGIEGLAEETKTALRNPQVREFLTDNEQRTVAATEAYANAVHTANQFARASFLEGFPELAALPAEHLQAGLAQLAQQNPQRFNQAMGVLNRVSQLQSAQQEISQQRDQQAFQHFESAVKSEDARLEGLIGKDAAQEANQALVKYLGDHGVERSQYLNTIRQNPVLLTAEARQTILKAAKYDQMMNAPKARPSREVPPVQRPGTSRAPGETTSENIQALERELTRTGSIKIAEKLMRAKGR